MSGRQLKFNIADIILKDAVRCMDAYETGEDRTDSRLIMATAELECSYTRGARGPEFNSALTRMINLYRELGARAHEDKL